MKNEEKHNNLEEKTMRDFLGKAIRECGYTRKIALIEEQIKNLNVELESARRLDGLLSILKLKNWEELDVSDEISDYNPETYFSFIGTKKEYDNLMNEKL